MASQGFLSSVGLAASRALDRSVPGQADADSAWVRDRFVTRARTLFYARLAFLTIGLGLIAVPAWSQEVGVRGPGAFVVYFGILGYSVANLLVVEHPRVGRVATFVTLCLDLVVLVYLVVVSGGLRSPLLATQLVMTTVFVILFPKPLAILPPLLTLPILARIHQILELPFDATHLLVLIWYSALNLIVVYVIVYLNEREEAAHRDVVALERDLQRLAVNEERSRLSREIHDGLGASLSSLIIQAEVLMGMAQDPSLKQEIRELKSCAEESIDELRRSLRMMRDDFELVPAVEDYCRTFAERSKLPVKVERSGRPRAIANEAQLAIFRILQESLANASKHSRAAEVSVRLGFDPDRMTVEVADDGVGFDAATVRPGHYGLTTMRERASQIGGEVTVDSGPGRGTRVRLAIPLLPG